MKRHYLLIIALATLFLLPTAAFAGPQISALQVGSRPTGLALAADGTLLISHGDGYTLSTVAPDGKASSVNVGTLPLTPLVDNALGRVFVANRVEGTLSVIEMHDGNPVVVNTLALGGAATAAALDASRHLVYVAVQPNQLIAIDGAALTVR